jgi:hypothetical protein
MYFGALSVWLSKNRILNESAIGTNVYSEEWELIARSLGKYDTAIRSIGAGDFSGFDGTQKTQLLNQALRVINRWYNDGPENARVREVLWADVTNSWHINGSNIYTWCSSLPSGHVLTVIINTMINSMAHRYCFYRAVGNDIVLAASYRKYVYSIFYGDDSVFSVSPIYASVFNEITLGPFMAELGLNYTSELKQVSTVPLRYLSQVSFLKRRFRFEPTLHRHLAPISMDTIKNMPYWTKDQDGISISRTIVDTALMELSLHEKQTFDSFAPILISSSEDKLRYTPKHTSFSILRQVALKCEDYA